jgi:hypothetical protein
VSKLYQKLQRTVDIKEEGVSSLPPPHPPLTMIMTMIMTMVMTMVMTIVMIMVMTMVMTIIMMITMLESCQRFVALEGPCPD